MAGRRVLVTGGTQGIGAALVRAMRRAGHAVVFTGRNAERLRQVAEENDAFGIRADISVYADNERTVAVCDERMGGIDILINNAGIPYSAPLGAFDVERMREVFATNVFGMVDLTNRIVPSMKARGEGDIVNIASTSGMKGSATGTAYAGSKWAVRGISQCWQAELRPHGIRVFSVCPSEVQTDWAGRTGRNNPNKLFAEDIADAIAAALAIRRRALWPEFAVFANNPWKES